MKIHLPKKQYDDFHDSEIFQKVREKYPEYFGVDGHAIPSVPAIPPRKPINPVVDEILGEENVH